MTAGLSAVTIVGEPADYADLKATVSECSIACSNIPAMQSQMSEFAATLAQIQQDKDGSVTELLKEIRELRAENARLSLQSRSRDVSTQFDSLPPITHAVQPSPPAAGASSNDEPELTSSQWIHSDRLRSESQLKKP